MGYTKHQEQAVLFNEGNVLVSASAGSGKTKVMVDRLIRLVSEEKAKIDEILAVTFTELAATEMKEKIREALIEKINDGKENLKSSLVEISNADISTMHSFCSKLIRRYFYEVGVSVDYEIIETEEAQELKNKVIEDLFYQLYEENNQDFLYLTDCLSSKRRDNSFRETILTIFEQVSSEEDFNSFLDESVFNYTKRGFNYFKDKILEQYKKSLTEYKKEFVSLKEELEKEDSESFKSHILILTDILTKTNEMLTFTNPFKYYVFSKEKFGSASSKGLNEYQLPLNEKFKALKGSFQEFVKEKFSLLEDEEVERKAFDNALVTTEKLVWLVKLFKDRYQEEKKKLNKLDFNDLEHFALQILNNEDIQKSVQQKYKYIFIDEYQDTNGIQEAIVNKIASNNLFMVGDVKQSIYAFRGCNHKIFQEKMEKFSKTKDVIGLHDNFRSTPAVINMVNKVFLDKMTKEDYGVDYCDAKLNYGGLYQNKETGTQYFGDAKLYLLPYKAKEKKNEKAEVYDILKNLTIKTEEDEEVNLAVSIIRNKLGQLFYDVKEKRERPIEYKDIVVLARSRSSFFQKLSKALMENGIPVSFDAKAKIEDYPEINVLINLLKFIDCAKQDVPLAFTLKKIWKLTDDELYEIRKEFKDKKYFYEAFLEYKNKDNDLGKRLKDFYDYFEEIRFLADFVGAKKVLEKVIEDKSFEFTLLASPLGKDKVKNIEIFLGEAVKNGIALTVREFLEKIENLEESSAFSESAENAVKIMTMHGSKGLEFPVVVLPNLNKTFNVQELRDKVLFDREYGLAVKSYDLENRSVSSTILTKFIKNQITLNSRKEELKLFYVALTRAKNELYLTATLKKEQKPVIGLGSSYYDFIYGLEGEETTAETIFKSKPEENEEIVIGKADETLKEIYKKNLLFTYKGDNLPLKTSVTKSLDSSSSHEDYEIPTIFLEEDVKEKGTLMHRFLEHALLEDERVSFQLENMLTEGVFTKEESELLDITVLENLLKSNIFKDIKDYKKYPEKGFIIELPAKELTDTDSEDKILLQGIIDLLCIKGDEVIILDYKYSYKDKDALIKTYKKQLDLYQIAVEKALNKKVIKKALVSLRKGEVIEID